MGARSPPVHRSSPIGSCSTRSSSQPVPTSRWTSVVHRTSWKPPSPLCSRRRRIGDGHHESPPASTRPGLERAL